MSLKSILVIKSPSEQELADGVEFCLQRLPSLSRATFHRNFVSRWRMPVLWHRRHLPTCDVLYIWRRVMVRRLPRCRPRPLMKCLVTRPRTRTRRSHQKSSSCSQYSDSFNCSVKTTTLNFRYTSDVASAHNGSALVDEQRTDGLILCK